MAHWYSTQHLLCSCVPQPFSPKTGFWSILWVMSTHSILARSVRKNRRKMGHKTVRLHRCYILKSQRMMKETSPNGINMKAFAYSACRQYLLAVLLRTGITVYARRVGMSTLCVGRMWTAVQKHTARAFLELFLKSFFFCALYALWGN